MSNYIYIATSLDGFIADRNGSVEWLDQFNPTSGADYGFTTFMNSIDALVMGRNTYDFVKDIEPWPYTKPVFVLSTTIQQIPQHLQAKVSILSGTPKNIVTNLHDMGYQNLYIDGGNTIQRFIEADLIDDLIITKTPILLGSGTSLFGELSREILFKHINTHSFESGLVQSHYVKLTTPTT